MTAQSAQSAPALLGQTVVVIGGSAGIGLELGAIATFDIDGGQLAYPDAGHGSLFQFHDSFVRQALLFLDS